MNQQPTDHDWCHRETEAYRMGYRAAQVDALVRLRMGLPPCSCKPDDPCRCRTG